MTTSDLPGLLTDPATLANLSHDEAEWAPAGTPAAAFRPQSTEDVQRAVHACAERGIPIVPRGCGHRSVRRRQRSLTRAPPGPSAPPTRPRQRPFATRRLTYPEDVCVPRSLVPAMLARVEEIGVKHGVRIAIIAHAGDGHPHPLLITPLGDDNARVAAQAAFADIIDQALDLGGTVTGEHGVGCSNATA